MLYCHTKKKNRINKKERKERSYEIINRMKGKKKKKKKVIRNEIGYDFRKIYKEQNKFILRSDKTIE